MVPVVSGELGDGGAVGGVVAVVFGEGGGCGAGANGSLWGWVVVSF